MKKTSSLEALHDRGFEFAAMTAAGDYLPRRSKAGATHRLIKAPGSLLLEPLRKPRKNRKQPKPFQRYAHIPIMETPTIPSGTTHLRYVTGRTEIIAPIDCLNDFRMRKGGTFDFGTYSHASDQFRSLMPDNGPSVIPQPAKAEPKKLNRIQYDTAPRPADRPQIIMTEKAGGMTRADFIAADPNWTDALLIQEGYAIVAPPPAPAPKPRKVLPPVATHAETPKAAKPKREGAAEERNGVRKPGAGGKTAAVWELCDRLLGELGRVPSKAEVLAAKPSGANEGMVGTNYSYWRRFYGHPKA